MSAWGPFAFAVLVFLPGAWLAFGLPSPGVTLSARTYLAIVLSPVVVVAEFYVLRLTGVPFDAAAPVILFANTPAALLVFRAWRRTGFVRHLPAALPFVVAWAIPVVLLGLKWRDWEISVISAHTFLHSDVVYSLANGFLRVEEAQLAGMTLSYPWGGHVHQAVVSWLLGTAPVVTFQMTNLVFLLATVGLISEVTAAVGGGRWAQVTSVIWVLFAVNAVGAVLQQALPNEILARLPVWGDERFTPWLRKYLFWSQHPAAHGLFAGILYLLAGPRQDVLSPWAGVLLAALFAGLAVVYPIIMPAALALLAARFVMEVSARSAPRDVGRSVVRLGVVGVVALVVTAGALQVISSHRTGGTGVALSSSWELQLKAAESLIALTPLLVAAGYSIAVRLREVVDRGGVLLLGAAASVLFLVLWSIPPGRNEYKFMFTAAMCLAPLGALAMEAFARRGGAWRRAAGGVVLIALTVAGVAPFVGRYGGSAPLHVRVDDFHLRLAADHPQAASLAAVSAQTPTRTIVLADSSVVHVPVFAHRSMYAPALMNTTHWGIGLQTRYLLDSVRGYGSAVIEERQGVLRALFQSDARATQLAALRAVQALQRPIAVLLEQPRQRHLTQTLVDSGSGTIIHRDARWTVWFWNPGADRLE